MPARVGRLEHEPLRGDAGRCRTARPAGGRSSSSAAANRRAAVDVGHRDRRSRRRPLHVAPLGELGVVGHVAEAAVGVVGIRPARRSSSATQTIDEESSPPLRQVPTGTSLRSVDPHRLAKQLGEASAAVGAAPADGPRRASAQ